jgi:hypothetical protein
LKALVSKSRIDKSTDLILDLYAIVGMDLSVTLLHFYFRYSSSNNSAFYGRTNSFCELPTWYVLFVLICIYLHWQHVVMLLFFFQAQVYEEIMRMFTTITVEASNAAYSQSATDDRKSQYR